MTSDIIHYFNIKILSFLFLLYFVFFINPLTVNADDFVVSSGILTKYSGAGGDITIPSNVQVIGVSAFHNNMEVTSVTIPEGCFEIRDGAFDACQNLQSVSLPHTLKDIGTLAFARCEKLKYIILPSKLESIGDGAFWNCYSLGSVTVPESVSTIGDFAFAGCTSLVLINVESRNKNFVADNNVLFTSDRKLLMQYPAGSTDATYTVPEGVERIGINAFNRAKNLKEINFPSTIKELSPRALSGCVGLTSVDLPESMQIVYEYAFQNCTNLCRLYVHNKNQKTVANAFRANTSLVIYGPESSLIKEHAKKYSIRFKLLEDESYDCPDTEKKF